MKRSSPTSKKMEDADCNGARSCRGGTCGLLQGPYTVAPGEVWVLGDNRNNSHDSRSWKGGQGAGVPLVDVRGRVIADTTPAVPTGADSALQAKIQSCAEEL